MKNIRLRSKKLIIVASLISFLSSVLFFGEMITIQTIISVSEQTINLSSKVILICSIILFISYIMYYIRLRVNAFTAYSVRYDLHKNLNENIFIDKHFFFESRKEVDSCLNILVNEIECVIVKYYKELLNIIYEITFLLIGTIYLFFLNYVIALISLSFFILSFFFLFVFSKKNTKLIELSNEYQTMTNHSLNEVLNISEYFLSGEKKFEDTTLYHNFLGYIKAKQSSDFNLLFVESLNNFISVVRELLILFLIYFIFKSIPLSILFMILYFCLNISEPFRQMGNHIHNINLTHNFRNRDLLKIKDYSYFNGITRKAKTFNSITVSHINKSFHDKNIINNFSYTFKTNNIYLLSGENGSGKTTLLKILVGLLPYDSGQIFYDDSPISKLSSYDISYCLNTDNEKIFYGTVKENITMFGALSDCKQYSFLKEKIKLILPDDYQINPEINNISSGEAQKIVVLRSLISNKKLIIFDETFSHIDASSIDCFSLINEHKRNHIFVLVSHVKHIDKGYYDYEVKM